MAQLTPATVLADRDLESIPIGHAEHLSDQFETLACSDVETLGGESRTQGVCHGFSQHSDLVQ